MPKGNIKEQINPSKLLLLINTNNKIIPFIMKRSIILFFAVALVSLFASCDEFVEDSVSFYIDGNEITADTVTVPINSYQEVQIKVYGSSLNSRFHYYWRSEYDYPIDLLYTDSLAFYHTASGDVMGRKLGAYQHSEFRMMFSDSVYHPGDIYKLKVTVQDYQRTLNFLVK